MDGTIENRAASDALTEVFTPNAIAMINGAGRIAMVNAKTEQMFGYLRVELLGQLIDMLLPDRLRAYKQELRNSVFSDRQTRVAGSDQNLSGLTKGGAEFPVEISLELIESEGETMILATIVDISERQRKMAESGYLAAILDASKDAIISQNLAGIVTTWNRAAVGLFGYAAEEVIGHDISMIIPDDWLETEELMMAQVRGG